MGKVIAYHLPGARGLVSVSPFCLKLDAFLRMIEENLYWAMVNDRWNTPENWPILKSTMLGGIAAPVRHIMAPFARRGVLKQLKGHGMGDHPAVNMAAIGKLDIDALAVILGDQSWFFGEEPTETDAVAFAQLANIHSVEFRNPLKAVIDGSANLVDFVQRFKQRFYA